MTRTVFLGFLLCTAAAALAQPVAITRVTIVDVAGGPPRPDMTVLIDGERSLPSAGAEKWRFPTRLRSSKARASS